MYISRTNSKQWLVQLILSVWLYRRIDFIKYIIVTAQIKFYRWLLLVIHDDCVCVCRVCVLCTEVKLIFITFKWLLKYFIKLLCWGIDL